jgi:hypothetical protein
MLMRGEIYLNLIARRAMKRAKEIRIIPLVVLLIDTIAAA